MTNYPTTKLIGRSVKLRDRTTVWEIVGAHYRFKDGDFTLDLEYGKGQGKLRKTITKKEFETKWTLV